MKILISDFVNRVGISKDIIKRLKGLKTLSHELKTNNSIQNLKNGKLENHLLLDDKRYLEKMVYLKKMELDILFKEIR